VTLVLTDFANMKFARVAKTLRISESGVVLFNSRSYKKRRDIFSRYFWRSAFQRGGARRVLFEALKKKKEKEKKKERKKN